MEKAKAAQVVNDLTLAKHIDVEVLSQTESRSSVIINLLGGNDATHGEFHAPRPIPTSATMEQRPRKLFRLSDASGDLLFDLVKEGEKVEKTDFDTNDVFLLDASSAIWVWRGLGASKTEKEMWITVARTYVRQLQHVPNAHLMPLAAVVEGSESPAFFKAIEVT